MTKGMANMPRYKRPVERKPDTEGKRWKEIGWRVYYRWLWADQEWVYSTHLETPCQDGKTAIARAHAVNSHLPRFEVQKTEEVIVNVWEGEPPWLSGERLRIKHPEGGLPVWDREKQEWVF